MPFPVEGLFESRPFIDAIAKDIVMKPNDPTKKPGAVPYLVAIMMPPIAGPTMRVLCHTIELSATAFIMSVISMSCGKMACRLGLSKACTEPIQKAITNTCHGSTISRRTSDPRVSSIRALVDWVDMISFLWFTLSATTPPKRLRTIAGIPAARPA